jgi:sigma-B regulation protein RsbU (phosphoserine phosphatase)
MLLTQPEFSSGTIDAAAPVGASHRIVVLLVDDQPLLGRAMRDLLASEDDIQFHFCQDPLRAIALAQELSPTVILQDLNMPEIDGLALLTRFRTNPRTREIPMIVLSGKEQPLIKAQAFARGASDYLVKLPDRVELIARIRHHSRGYIAQLERNEAHRKLAESERQLATEVVQAADYVKSLLPDPIKDGPVKIHWRFIPSTQLGGDAFGYQWLDEQHIAVYLLDVSGHGVGAALLAVSVLHTLLHQTLPKTDFHDPASVMRGLNHVFHMDKHGGRFFTIWYGVYAVPQRSLTFTAAGHPPALLFCGATSCNAQLQELSASGPPIGTVENVPFANATIQISEFGQLFLYSDGVVEVGKPTDEQLDHAAFTKYVTATGPRDNLMDQVLARARRSRHGEALIDDCSLMQIDFA